MKLYQFTFVLFFFKADMTIEHRPTLALNSPVSWSHWAYVRIISPPDLFLNAAPTQLVLLARCLLWVTLILSMHSYILTARVSVSPKKNWCRLKIDSYPLPLPLIDYCRNRPWYIGVARSLICRRPFFIYSRFRLCARVSVFVHKGVCACVMLLLQSVCVWACSHCACVFLNPPWACLSANWNSAVQKGAASPAAVITLSSFQNDPL